MMLLHTILKMSSGIGAFSERRENDRISLMFVMQSESILFMTDFMISSLQISRGGPDKHKFKDRLLVFDTR